MTDAERDLLLAVAAAALVGTNVSIYDYDAGEKLRDAWHNIRIARKEVTREMEVRAANVAAGPAVACAGCRHWQGACSPAG